MFDYYRKPPYEYVTYSTIRGKVYKITHYVSNGLAGSKMITTKTEILNEKISKNNNREHKENYRSILEKKSER